MSLTAPVDSPSSSPLVPSPAARRARRPSWRDPRLALGVLLVCASVVLGARVLGGAADAPEVLVAARPLVAGAALEPSDLRATPVRFSDDTAADVYLPADASLDGLVLGRSVEAGELLPRAAVVVPGPEALAELPLAVEVGRVPAAVSVGSVVDVWFGPAESVGEAAGASAFGDGSRPRRTGAQRLLTDVPVLAVTQARGLGPESALRVVVGVTESQEQSIARVVDRLRDSSVLLVNRPGGPR